MSETTATRNPNLLGLSEKPNLLKMLPSEVFDNVLAMYTQSRRIPYEGTMLRLHLQLLLQCTNKELAKMFAPAFTSIRAVGFLQSDKAARSNLKRQADYYRVFVEDGKYISWLFRASFLQKNLVFQWPQVIVVKREFLPDGTKNKDAVPGNWITASKPVFELAGQPVSFHVSHLSFPPTWDINLSKLQELSLHKCVIPKECFCGIMQWIGPLLQYLSIRDVRIPGRESYIALAEKIIMLPVLRHLELVDIKVPISEPFDKFMAALLTHLNWNQFETLTLQRNVGPRAFEVLCEKLKEAEKLNILNLSNNSFTKEQFVKMAQSTRTQTLVCIVLNNTNMTADGLREFANRYFISTAETQMRFKLGRMVLRENPNLFISQMDSETFRVNLIPNYLIEVDLSGSMKRETPWEKRDDTLYRFLLEIRMFRNLKTLLLSNCCIGDKEIKALKGTTKGVYSERTRSSLDFLDLSGNRFSGEELADIDTEKLLGTSLQVLSLSDNPCIKGLAAVVKMIRQEGCKLKMLELDGMQNLQQGKLTSVLNTWDEKHPNKPLVVRVYNPSLISPDALEKMRKEHPSVTFRF